VTQAYGRLVEIHNMIGSKVPYAADVKAGFLVTAPDELGIGGFVVEMEVKENGQKLLSKSKFGATVEDTVNALIQQLTEKK